MTSQRKSGPLLAIAAVAAIGALVAGCNGGGSSGGQTSGYDAPANSGYVNTNPNGEYVNTNPNLPASMGWENTAQQNGYNAINDENNGGGGGDDSAGGDGTGN